MQDWTDNLRQARQRRGMTQAGLATAAGVGRGTVAQIEQGLRSSPATRRKIAEALDLEPAELFPERPPSAEPEYRATVSADRVEAWLAEGKLPEGATVTVTIIPAAALAGGAR